MNEQEGIQLTLFPADSPANPSVLPGTEKAKKMTVTSGQRCLELYRNFSPLGSLVKMCLESSIWHSTKCYLNWNIKAMKSNRLLFQLLESVPHTEESEFLFWATPNTMDSLPSRSYEAMKRQATNGGRKNRSRPGNLREQIDPLMCQAYADASREANMMFPTPTTQETEHPDAELTDTGRRLAANGNSHSLNLADTVKMWPTANAMDWKDTGNMGILAEQMDKGHQATLCRAVAKDEPTTTTGSLNPTWVEWLQGFPLGWTDLNA